MFYLDLTYNMTYIAVAVHHMMGRFRERWSCKSQHFSHGSPETKMLAYSLAKKRTFPHSFQLVVKGHFPREEENLFRMIEHCLFMEVDVALWNRKIALWIQCGDDGVCNGGTLCKSLWHTSLFRNEKKERTPILFHGPLWFSASLEIRMMIFAPSSAKRLRSHEKLSLWEILV